MTTQHNSLEVIFRTEAGVNPTSPVVGDMYYDTTNDRLLRYMGLNIRELLLEVLVQLCPWAVTR